MRKLFRLVTVGLVAFAWYVAPGAPAIAATLDTTADRVFGQPDFTASLDNNGGLSARSLRLPYSLALDTHGNLYVADGLNNRVLEYDAPLSSHAAANRVFGQSNFSSDNTNNGGLSANSLNNSFAVALDAQGDLYVADTGNNRVLEYDDPLTTDTTADRVFGQPDFTHNTANNGGLSADSLHGPDGVALDGQGDLYVADTSNNRVLEYNAPLASDATADHVFGQPDFKHNLANLGNSSPSANSLLSPFGLGLDAKGNLYVADTGNNRVLVYVFPLSGGTSAFDVIGQPDFTHNTAGTSADNLFSPFAVALDAQSDLYVADELNNRVLEYDSPRAIDFTADRVFGQPDFTSSTRDNGGVSAGSLGLPSGVALDGQGNLYVADGDNSRVLEYDLPVEHGRPSLAALSPSTVAAGSASFTLTVTGAGFVSGSVVRWDGSNRATTYLSSTQLNASISAADVVSGGPFAVTVFTPSPGGGSSTLINLSLYHRVGHDATADVEWGQPTFLANTVNNALLPGANGLNLDTGLAVDDRTGRLFVADFLNNRVLSWPNAAAQANGQPPDLVIGQPDFAHTAINNDGLSANSLWNPFGVALDAQGDLYVADQGNSRVLEYNAPLTSGMAASRVFGQGGSFTNNQINNGGLSANSLFLPNGVAVDAQGHLYIADTFNNRVLEFDSPLSSNSTADRVFGQPDFTHNKLGNGASSLFEPSGLALDAQGDLYVADPLENRVLEYNNPLSSDTVADRVFGQPDFTHFTPNSGGLNASGLFEPGGVALDAQGNLYVADTDNNRVLEYDAPLVTDASADRVFGQPDFTHNLENNGGLSANSLDLPRGVALDAQRNLYVADSNNNRVLEYDWALARLALPLIRH